MEERVDLNGGAEAMSELEKVESEYRNLQTEVIYSSFEGEVDPAKRLRLERLTDQLMELTHPVFTPASAAESA